MTPIQVFTRLYRAHGVAHADDMACAAHAALALTGEHERMEWAALRTHIEGIALSWNERDYRAIDLLDPREIDSLVQPPEIVTGIMRAGELAIMIGAAKTRKTWLALDLCLALATGGLWMRGVMTTQQSVLYIDAEGSPACLAERLRMLRVGRHMRDSDIPLRILSTRGAAPTSRSSACEMVRKGISHSDATFVIIDTLSAFFPTENENDNAEATATMSAIVAVCEEMACACLLVHHTPKGGGSDRSVVDSGAGAGAYTRRADTVMSVREADSELYFDCRSRSLPPIGRGCILFENATMVPIVAPAPDTSDIPAPQKKQKRNILLPS